METDKENWDLDGVMTAADAEGSSLRGKFNGAPTEFFVVSADNGAHKFGICAANC